MMKRFRRLDRGLIASLVVGQAVALLRWVSEERAEGVGLSVMALVGLAAGLWLYLIVWTVRRMARWRNELKPLAFSVGVLGWGGTMWLTESIRDAVQGAGGADHLLSATFAWSLLFHAAIGFPTTMWAGYWFSRIMGLDAMLEVVRQRWSAAREGSGPGTQTDAG